MDQYYEKLMECVLDGEEDEAVEITRAEIEAGTDPLDIVQKCLVPILDDVGDKFSKLEIFLPDLIMCAGTITHKMAPVMKRLYDEMAEPKYVVAVGGCAISGGPFKSS